MASVTTIDGKPSPRDEHAVDRPQQRAGRKRQERDQSDRQACLRQQAGDHAADAEDRADRDVDLAAEDDERHPHGRDQHRRAADNERAKLVASEEARCRDRHDEQNNCISGGDRELAAVSRDHDRRCSPSRLRATVAPSARASRIDFLGGCGAVELADDRSAVHHGDPVAHAEDLGQLGRDHHDRESAGGEVAHEPVDLGLGADVHALGRLVEDQDRGRAGQPAGERDFLLVAAGQVAHRSFERRRS